MEKKECKVIELFKSFLEDLNLTARHSLFTQINIEDLKEIEEKAQKDKELSKELKKMCTLLREIKIDFDDIHRQLYQLYWQIYVYFFLKYKKRLNTRIIAESKERTPDLEVELEGKYISIEIKTPTAVEPNIKYKKEQEENLIANIKIEEEIKKKKIVSNISVFQPYYKEGSEGYHHSSVRLAVDTLIDKINQNFKRGQFPSKYKKRILWVVLDQLLLIGSPKESSTPIYPCLYSKSCVSGELWHVAFGSVGNILFKLSEFEGKGNIDGILEKNGILIDYEEIDTIIFHVINFSRKEVVAMYKIRHEDPDLQWFEKFLDEVADYVNNQFNENSYYWRLFDNID